MNEDIQQPGEPLKITVRPRSDNFARVADKPQQELPSAPWLGQEGGDDALPPSAELTQGTLPSAPWAQSGSAPADSPLSAIPSAPWVKPEPKKEEEDVRPMPDPATALMHGIASGWSGVGKTAAMPLVRPKPDEQSPAAAPYEMRDLWNPGRAVSKTAYALGHGSPTIATGVAGGVTGAALTGGNPIGALAGGSMGAMLGTAIQTMGPVYAEELKKTPEDVDGAWNRALTQSGISSMFSGAGWAAFPLKFFNGPIKNLITQAVAVQPGIGVAEKATQNVAADKPITEGLGQAYIQGTAGGTVPMVGQLGVKVGMKGVKPIINDLMDTSEMLRQIQTDITPMAAHRATADQRAAAKDFASERRWALHHWSEMHDKLMKVADADQRKLMWEAADAESVALQQGMTPAQIAAAGIGTSTLPPRAKAILDVLQQDSQFILDEAKRVGIFEGEGLPSYVPRIVAMMGADGPTTPKGGAPNLKPEVTGIHTTTPQMKGRRHLTVEETEAAAKAKLGGEAEVVKDIATLPMATARLAEAVAGRTLINKIKEIGDSVGMELVRKGPDPDGTWFTINHPSFTQYKVRKDANNKVVRSEDGNPIFDKEHFYIHPGFKGPLKAVLQTGETGQMYKGLMEVKSRAVMAIMYSPLIHNAVEWGRALGAMPMKVGTGYIYFKGNAFRHGYKFDENPFGPFKYTYQAMTGTRQKDPALNPAVEHAIKIGGVVPIGKRYGVQDITGIMEEPNLKPGRGWTAQALGETLGQLPQKGMTKEQVKDSVKASVDKAGDFWHQTLLWDRIADLQFGLYADYRAKLLKKGYDDATASRMAGHLANRYAGALPMEAMSEQARKIANLTMFSRSFTLGNIGAMKDTINGLPRDVQAQIMRDAGPLMHAKSKGYMRRKARAIMAIDIALAYAATTAFQSGMRILANDEEIGEVGRDYVKRFFEVEEKIKKDPNPLKVLEFLEGLTEMHHNEPGRKERFLIGNQDDGTAIYGRAPMGKIGEEFVGWPTSPLEMAKKKESTMLRPLVETFQNNKGFGRKVYSPDDPALKIVQDWVWHFMRSQVPADSIEGGWELLTGQGSPDERKLSKMKIGLPLAGISISKGAPGGPAVGEMFKTEEKFKDKLNEAMPEIRKLIKRGHMDRANAIMDELKLTKEHRQYIYKTSVEPASRLKGRKVKDFYRHADPEALKNFEWNLRRQP